MKHIVLYILFLSTSLLNAQFSAEKLDEKFTPPSGSIFDGDESVLSSGSHSSYFRRHEINFQAFHLLRSKLNFEYRYSLNEYLSFGLAGGYNFAPDYILTAFSETENVINVDEHYSFYNTLRSGTYTGVGFNLNPSIRVGMDEYFFDYGFVQLDYRFDFYQYTLPGVLSGTTITNPMNSSALNLIYGAKFSYEITNDLSLINTFYYGVGGRIFNLYEVQGNFDNNNEYYDFTSDTPKRTRAMAFTLVIGYNVGIAFNTKKSNKND